MEEVEVERVDRVEEISVEKENDCEIIRTSKKIAAPKKKPTQVEVKVEGEERKPKLARFGGISTHCFEGGDEARV